MFKKRNCGFKKVEEQNNSRIWLENIGEIVPVEDEFFWMVPDVFVSACKSCVASPYFSFDQENWRLVIIPSDGDTSDLIESSCVGLFLWMKSCKIVKKKYHVCLSVETPDGEDICIHKGELDSHNGFGTWNFIPRYDDSYTCSGRIKFCCIIRRIDDTSDMHLCSVNESEIEEDKNKTECADDNQKESELKGVDRLTKNLGDLLLNEWGSDVVLKTRDQVFKAHRNIIAARSPVFLSMFQLDMNEKKTGEVDISDCSAAGFKVFLQYLYKGKADTMSSDNVFDLYYIADKYQVEDLKSDCVEYMKNTLSVDNLCDVINLSLRHSISDLLNFATRFFCRNIKKIVKTVQWQKFITENPIQANELYIQAINA